MYSNFKEQAIEYVKTAVQEDNAGNYAKAFPLYMNALEYFKTHLKYEKNPKIREAITQKFTEYRRRAEEIRAVLDERVCGYEGGDEEDPEQSKLRAGFNSAIIREKPNVKWNNVVGLESAEQASQEAVILPVKFPQFFMGAQEMYRNFKEQAIEYVEQAVQEDNAGEIWAVLDERGSGDEGGDGEDPEQSMLRAGLKFPQFFRGEFKLLAF
ncbi:hypothetical protein SLA2020_223470 [Shorea laevis]